MRDGTTSTFTAQRGVALASSLCGSVFGWYSLLLIANADGAFSPENKQWVGLVFALSVGVLVWVWKCFTIQQRAPNRER